MGNVARHRLAVLVPWVALIAVTAFALARLGRSRVAEPDPDAATASAPPATAQAASAASTALETAAQAAEHALDQALVDLEAAREEAAGARRRETETRSRLQDREATLAVVEARLEALEAVSVEEPAVEEPAVEEPAPEAAVRLLLAPGALGSDVDAVDADLLGSVAVAGPVLRQGSIGIVHEVVARLAARALDWSEAERARLAKDLAGGSDVKVASVRAVGVLALGGAAPHLLQLCRHADPAMRAAAAHALSRVPDREAVEAEVIQHLPGLLDDEDVQVRRAALLLAEAVLGAGVDEFDPDAGESARRVGLERLLERLGAG